MCMWDDGESPTVHRSKKCRARKEHRCEECRRTIEIGEEYEYAFSIFDGDPYSHHTCRHCLTVRDWLLHVCGGYLYGGVLEDIEEHFNESPDYNPRWLRIAASGMRRQWRKADGSMRRVMSLPKKMPTHTSAGEVEG